MYRRSGIGPADGAKSNGALAHAVAGGAHKTREQLAGVLQAAGFAATGLALAYRIMFAEASGVLVSGAPVRSAGGALRQTYALFDERVPPAPAGLMDRPLALAELVRRYFGSRGPATERDCADWSGLTVADVRSGLRTARELDPGSLEAGEIGGATFYWRPAPDDGAGSPRGPGRIDLIQCYDEYVMGYSSSRHFLAGKAPFAPVAGEPMHLVLRDGRLAGVWRHAFVRGGCEVDLRLEPGSGTGHGEPVGAAVAAYGRFLGMPAVLR